MTIRTVTLLPIVYFNSADGHHLTLRAFDPPLSSASGTIELSGDLRQIIRKFERFHDSMRQARAIVGTLLVLIAALMLVVVHVVSNEWLWAVYWCSLPAIGLLRLRKRVPLFPLSDLQFALYKLIGGRMLTTTSNRRSLERSFALIQLRWAVMDGVRPTEWDPDDVKNAIALLDDSAEDGLGNWYAHEYALDRGGYVAAGWYLERALAVAEAGKLGPVQAAWIYRSAAYYAARYQRDPDAARRWLSKTMIIDHERQTDMRVEAAILEAEGRWDESRRLALKGLQYTAPSITPGFRHADIDRLKELTLVPDWDQALR